MLDMRTDGMLAMPGDDSMPTSGVGDFFKERVDSIPSLVEDDVFVPPVGVKPKAQHKSKPSLAQYFELKPQIAISVRQSPRPDTISCLEMQST